MTGLPACRDEHPGEDSRPTPAAVVGDSALDPEGPAGADSVAAAWESAPGETAAPGPGYRRIPIPGPGPLASLSDSLGSAWFRTVLKINRVDLAHVRKGDSLIVPEGVAGGDAVGPDSLAFSPFSPVFAGADSVSKLLLISIRVQAFAGYEWGRLVRWGPTSTGRKDMPTPVGLYHVNWKDKERTSTFNEEWQLRWVANLDNFLGTSIHQYALPGRPASHSCVRLLEEDAQWLYGWSNEWRLTADGRAILAAGTPVVIFGEYAFGARPPWKLLPEDATAATLSAAEMADALRISQSAGGR